MLYTCTTSWFILFNLKESGDVHRCIRRRYSVTCYVIALYMNGYVQTFRTAHEMRLYKWKAHDHCGKQLITIEELSDSSCSFRRIWKTWLVAVSTRSAWPSLSWPLEGTCYPSVFVQRRRLLPTMTTTKRSTLESTLELGECSTAGILASWTHFHLSSSLHACRVADTLACFDRVHAVIEHNWRRHTERFVEFSETKPPPR